MKPPTVTTWLAVLAADPERIADVPADALPELVGAAAALHARLFARLTVATTPAIPVVTPDAAANGKDKLLRAKEAAERLSVNERWMYRHASRLPFTVRLASGTLRFSERGLEAFQRMRKERR